MLLFTNIKPLQSYNDYIISGYQAPNQNTLYLYVNRPSEHFCSLHLTTRPRTFRFSLADSRQKQRL